MVIGLYRIGKVNPGGEYSEIAIDIPIQITPFTIS
jgi:hypothetical protein